MQFLNVFPFPYQEVFSWVDLMYFALGSFVIIGFLLFYYSRLSQSNNDKSSLLDAPIYNTKDIFSQEIVGDSNFALTEKVTTTWSKTAIYTLVVLIITTSMYEFLGIVDNYFYF